MFTDTIRQAGDTDYITGHRTGRAGDGRGSPHLVFREQRQESSSSTPPPPPQQKKCRRNPPHAREDEVEARTAKRAEMSREKSKQAEVLKEQGNACFRQGKYEEAIEYYQKAISVHGPRPTYYINIAAACLELELYLQAEEACDSALEYDPRSIKARYCRGIAHRNMFAFKLAIEGGYKTNFFQLNRIINIFNVLKAF